MATAPGVVVRPVDSDDADETADRITMRAFGHVHDPSSYARRRPERREGHYFLAWRDGEAAGTGGAFDYGLRLPGGADVPVWGVTGVGVRPDHRRQGVLTGLMARILDEAADRGTVAAVLFASEGTIYPRFGFGMANPRAHARVVSRRAGFRPGSPVVAGRVRAVDIGDVSEWQQSWSRVFERARDRRPGEITRSDAAWQTVLAARDGKDDRLFLLHEDAAGTVDGYAIYTITDAWRGSGPEHELAVQELVATSEAAELALWRALFDHDLVGVVSAEVPVDWVVPAVVVDPWAVRMRTYPDGLWARLLDVPRALGERRYRAPGRLVLGVLDEGRPTCAGTFRVEADARGGAICEPTDDAADLVLGSSVLAQLWLGGGSASRLVRAGLVGEQVAGAAALADLMFGWDPAPFTTQHF